MIFELTDKYILIYNKKNKCLNKEIMPDNIIKNNKIYDYQKLLIIINKICLKYKINESFFKTKIYVLIFEKLSPSEIFLIKSLFKNINNSNIKIVHATSLISDNVIFNSGEYLYYKDQKLNKINNKDTYILAGYCINIDKVKKSLIKKYKINILEYENSNTILFEKI